MFLSASTRGVNFIHKSISNVLISLGRKSEGVVLDTGISQKRSDQKLFETERFYGDFHQKDFASDDPLTLRGWARITVSITVSCMLFKVMNSVSLLPAFCYLDSLLLFSFLITWILILVFAPSVLFAHRLSVACFSTSYLPHLLNPCAAFSLRLLKRPLDLLPATIWH